MRIGDTPPPSHFPQGNDRDVTQLAQELGEAIQKFSAALSQHHEGDAEKAILELDRLTKGLTNA